MIVENNPKSVRRVKAPPSTSKTVLVLTSPSFLKAKPSSKNPGKDKSKAILENKENPFEKEFNDPNIEITKSKTNGIANGISDFLFSVSATTKGIQISAAIPPTNAKIWLTLPKLKAVKATTSNIKNVSIDLFLTKKLLLAIV